MKFIPYLEYQAILPREGKHIVAYHTDDTIVVYQAYNRRIGEFALRHQHFGGDFRYSRMSWIKPNFLWMMYRSGWGTKLEQEMILAITISCLFFESILEHAVYSVYDNTRYASREEWQQAISHSEVRMQWDPDHDPNGEKLSRKAIQLGLRGDMLSLYGKEAILSIDDMTPFVTEQRQHLQKHLNRLVIPKETVYAPTSRTIRQHIGLSELSKTGGAT